MRALMGIAPALFIHTDIAPRCTVIDLDIEVLQGAHSDEGHHQPTVDWNINCAIKRQVLADLQVLFAGLT
jgi:hypothetical protein